MALMLLGGCKSVGCSCERNLCGQRKLACKTDCPDGSPETTKAPTACNNDTASFSVLGVSVGKIIVFLYINGPCTQRIQSTRKAIHTLFGPHSTIFFSPDPVSRRYPQTKVVRYIKHHYVRFHRSAPCQYGHPTVAFEHIDRFKSSWLSEASSSQDASRSTNSNCFANPFDTKASCID